MERLTCGYTTELTISLPALLFFCVLTCTVVEVVISVIYASRCGSLGFKFSQIKVKIFMFCPASDIHIKLDVEVEKVAPKACFTASIDTVKHADD